MERIARTTATHLVAEALRAECASGKWDARLPGTRILADRLGVSPPTVTAALMELVAEGVLRGGGERRAFRVVENGGGTRAKGTVQRSKRLLIIANQDLWQAQEDTRNAVALLRHRMTSRGWQVETQTVNYRHVNRMQLSWDRRIDLDGRVSIIAVSGRPPLAEWAVARKVRMLFLGGMNGGLPIPLVGVDIPKMAAAALQKLTALGHVKIMLPLCDRPEPLKSAIREVTKRAIEAAGGAYVSSYHNPESNYLEADVSSRMLGSLSARRAPTAFVFLHWKELIGAYCDLTRHGLHVPEDVSLMLLNDSSEAEWFNPALARFRFPIERMVIKMIRWLEDETAEAKTSLLPAEYIQGDSIARMKNR